MQPAVNHPSSLKRLCVYDVDPNPRPPKKSNTQEKTNTRVNETALNQLEKQNNEKTHSRSNTVFVSESESSSEDSLFDCIPLNWKKPLEKLIRHPELVIALLNQPNSKMLNEAEKNSIVLSLLDSGKKILLESIKMELPLESRNVLLKKGIEMNDLDIVNAAINGIDGQDQLNFDDWSCYEPINYIQYLKNQGAGPTIISKLCSISSLTLNDVKDAEWRKFVYNLFNLKGDDAFYLNRERVEYQGCYRYLFFSKLEEYLQSCYLQNNNSLNQKMHLLFKNSNCNLSPKEQIDTYNQTGFLLVHGGGYQQQSIDVLFFKDSKTNLNYFLTCFSGENSTIEAYEITKIENLNEKLFRDMSYLSKTNIEDEVLGFYYEDLPEILCNANPDCLTDVFEKGIGSMQECLGYSQISSLMALLSAFSAMVLNGANDLKSIQPTFKNVMKLDFFFKYWGISNYLKYCENNNLHRMDNHLIEMVLSEARNMSEDSRDYMHKWREIAVEYNRLCNKQIEISQSKYNAQLVQYPFQ